jgi:O-antigen/teichoic acid export membrane protein
MIKPLTFLGKHSIAYGLGNGFTKFVSLLALPFLTRFLSPQDFAVIAMFAVLGVVYRSLFGLGLGVSTGLVYFQHSELTERPLVIGASILVQTVSAVILLSLTLVFSATLSHIVLMDQGYGSLITLYTLSICLQLIAQPLLLDLQYRNQAVKYVALTSACGVVNMAAILTLVIGQDHGLRGWVEGDLIGSAVTLGSLLVLNREGYRLRVSRQSVKSLIANGLPLIPSTVFLFIIQCSGTYMLQWFVPKSQVGIYGIGYSLGMALGLATTGFSSAWFPFFQSYFGKDREAQTMFSTVLLSYTIVFGFACYLFLILAKPTVLLLLDSRYVESFRIVGLTAVAQFFLGLWGILLPGMYFAKETHYVTFVQGVSAIIVLALNLLLIPALGIEGAALSFCLGAVAMVLVQQGFNTVRHYQVSIHNWKRAGSLLMALAAMATIQMIVNVRLPLTAALAVGFVILSIHTCISWFLLSNQERSRIVGWAPLWVRSQIPH